MTLRPVRRPWLLALLLPLLMAAHVPGRAGQITGVVTEAASGDPLPGANVLVVGTSLGTATDADGRFALRLDDGTHTLRVTFAGYAPRTVENVVVTDGETTEVRLALSTARLDEVRVEERESGGAAREIRSARPMMDGVAASPAPAGIAGRAASSAAAPADSDARGRDDGERTPRRQTPAGVLTAGDIDDGLNWDAFLRYVGRTQRAQAAQVPRINLDYRVVLRVVDRTGDPVAGARVRVTAVGGQRARRLVTETGTDGRLALFPFYDFGAGVRELRVEVTAPGDQGAARVETIPVQRGQPDRAVRIQLPQRAAERPRAMDLAFVIDVTGSMTDELRYLTTEFEHIVERLEQRYPGVDLRFGLVAYRDHGDDFVVRRHDFTRSAREMQRRLAGLRAGGGGDYPEAMDEALESMLDLDWRTGTAARVAFLVADAPPHDNRTEQALDAVREARARGLRLYPVAASGVADQAELLMRTAAVLTQGRHLFLTDDSGVGLSHQEPKVPCYAVTQLDHLVLRVLASELEGRRVEPHADEIVREVGSQNAGVCHAGPVTQQQRPQTPRRIADAEPAPRSVLGYE
jgi:hypothetical protein